MYGFVELLRSVYLGSSVQLLPAFQYTTVPRFIVVQVNRTGCYSASASSTTVSKLVVMQVNRTVSKDFCSMNTSSTTVPRFIVVQVNRTGCYSANASSTTVSQQVSMQVNRTATSSESHHYRKPCLTALVLPVERNARKYGRMGLFPESHIGIHFTDLRKCTLTLDGDG
ncbi:uncharacterized protein EAE98_004472 [Botrytis deweyae]|uniref:Uncharacterized protein n=1 Tax=Botrytis deweyae TaxID=2478750 RepID=A0ABQ7IR03_9HELO|nr:uncharacterized protein EAE98_004472 [Botrytis deweyae]KAF7931736.1 hypothetical protein EAE98_004472 [Botrytis deweyae]